MEYHFGSGVLFGVPLLNLDGSTVTNPTPAPFGALQDVSVDISSSKKELYGMYQYPLAVARGTAKVDCKAKSAAFSAMLFNLIFGENLNAGEIDTAFNESVTVGAGDTGTPTHSAYEVLDLGVTNPTTGLPLTRVAGSAVASMGQYAYGSGVYSFCGSWLSLAVDISYAYTSATAAGVNFTINNQLLGLAPYFKVRLYNSFEGKQMNLTLNKCVSTKLTLASKLEDFWIPEFDFSAMADDSQQVGTISVGSP